jgi:hypothetical protein
VSAGNTAQAIYIASVLTLYADLPDTPSRPSPIDQAMARKLHSDAVPLSLVESALLLGTSRRLARPSHLPLLPQIRSLAYFLPVIAELQSQPLPAGYLDYLRLKVQKLSLDSRANVQKSTFLDER